MIKQLLTQFFLYLLIAASAVSAAPTGNAWIDIPKRWAFSSEFMDSKIGFLIDAYHELNKSNLNLLNARIRLLERIIKAIDEHSNIEKPLNKIKDRAKKKSWYLVQIKNIYTSTFLEKCWSSIGIHHSVGGTNLSSLVSADMHFLCDDPLNARSSTDGSSIQDDLRGMSVTGTSTPQDSVYSNYIEELGLNTTSLLDDHIINSSPPVRKTQLYSHAHSDEPCGFTGSKVDTKIDSPIFLKNKILYEYDMGAYWGLFHLEVVDPCHRQLTPYYLRWQEAKTYKHFFLWLEDQEVPFNTVEVDYLTEEEIYDYEISVNNEGHFVHYLSEKIVDYNDKTSEYIFIISLDSRIFIIKAKDAIRHTSLSLGRPVLGAGSMKISHGNLIYIDVNSGHYQPKPENLYAILNILKNMKLKIDFDKLTVMYFSRDMQIVENGKTFMDMNKAQLSMDPSEEIEVKFRKL